MDKKLIITDENVKVYKDYLNVVGYNNEFEDSKYIKKFSGPLSAFIIILVSCITFGLPVVFAGLFNLFLVNVMALTSKVLTYSLSCLIFILTGTVLFEGFDILLDKVIDLPQKLSLKIVKKSKEYKEFIKENSNVDFDYDLADIAYQIKLYDAYSKKQELENKKVKHFKIYSDSFKVLSTSEKIEIIKDELKFLKYVSKQEELQEEYLENIKEEPEEEGKIKKLNLFDVSFFKMK